MPNVSLPIAQSLVNVDRSVGQKKIKTRKWGRAKGGFQVTIGLVLIEAPESFLLIQFKGGGLAEWLEALTCNPDARGSSFLSDH